MKQAQLFYFVVQLRFFMKKAYPILLSLAIALIGCTEDNSPTKATQKENGNEKEPVAVDYSAGRAMNKRLGKGINLGNSWDSQSWGKLDGGWGNPIEDNDFKIIKEAGFNSVRLPVRWNEDSDYETHTVNPDRLKGVKEDIQLALDQGLAVVVNFHHYTTLNAYGDGAFHRKADSISLFEAEKAHFLALWDQVSKELNKFPDSMVVLEILNEPTIPGADIVNDIMLSAYEVIRKNAPKKTIMFEAFHAAKFADLDNLTLPEDGNIIYSGHYYEPYEFSHEGHGYGCKGDESYANTAANDFKNYVLLAQKLYPDINGGHVPMNMGEFGVSGGTGTQSKCNDEGVVTSNGRKALWAKKTIQAAESYDISWHYWGFTNVGGFEAYNRDKDEWYSGFPDAFFSK